MIYSPFYPVCDEIELPEEKPLISTATEMVAQQRVMQVSRVAMWLGKCGIPTFGEQQDTEEPYFIPSAC